MKRAAEAAGMPDAARAYLDELPVEFQMLVERRLGPVIEGVVADQLAQVIQRVVVEQTELVLADIARAVAAWPSLEHPLPLPDATRLAAALQQLPWFSLEWYKRHMRRRGLLGDVDILSFDVNVAKRIEALREESTSDEAMVATLLFMARYTTGGAYGMGDGLRRLLFDVLLILKHPALGSFLQKKKKKEKEKEKESGSDWFQRSSRTNEAEAYELMRYWLGPLLPAEWADTVLLHGPDPPAASLMEIREAYDRVPATRTHWHARYAHFLDMDANIRHTAAWRNTFYGPWTPLDYGDTEPSDDNMGGTNEEEEEEEEEVMF